MNLREGGQTWEELAGRRGDVEMLLVFTGSARKVKKLFRFIVTIINGDIWLKCKNAGWILSVLTTKIIRIFALNLIITLCVVFLPHTSYYI